ncbi:MAG: VOC family protein [Acidimicrobiia bacterium]
MSRSAPVAAFKDFCIDANDPRLLGEFWGAALGLSCAMQDGGDAYLSGPTAQHRVWINGVGEPKTVKHRMHLDIWCSDVGDLIALGADVVDDTSFRWTVMSDPEGGEFCAFVRPDPPQYRLMELNFDCSSDHVEIASWWAGVLGGRVETDPEGFSAVADVPGAPFGSMVFGPVPERKTAKNRVHIDVTATSIDALMAQGATVLRPPDSEISWTVMADPEGNEFCAFVS